MAVLIGSNDSDTISGGSDNDIIYGYGTRNPSLEAGAINLVRVGQNFQQPVFATSAPGDADHLFVVEKTGQIMRLDPATGTKTLFLDIPANEILTNGEQGLLGLAFHPDYATNGKFYVNIVNADGNLEVREYQRSAGDPNVADPATMRKIITIPHPFGESHDGGFIGFSPKDGYLYISVGDGVNINTPQDKNSLLGKILRIDVDNDDFPGDPDRNYRIPPDNPFVDRDGADEVWAYGLRNPWRISFDSLTGDLYIADVGAHRREEINFIDADDPGGANFGWPRMEGSLGTPPPGSVLPIFEYGHDVGESVTGGYVYRGNGGSLVGAYFFADFITGRLWTLNVVDGKAVNAVERTSQLRSAGINVSLITSFGVDGNGELYLVTYGGNIFRFDFEPESGDLGDRLFGGGGRDQLRGGPGDDMLSGGEGNDALYGGIGADLMIGGTGSDTYFVDNRGDVVRELRGQGGDVVNASITYTLAPNVEHLNLIGNGNISGTGNALVNHIKGNAGANLLNGREGNDVLTGGLGADRFQFNTAIGTSNDLIRDFTPGVDRILLENAVFTALTTTGRLAASAFQVGPSADDASDRIIYNPDTGALFYDPDGSGPMAQIRFATTLKGLAMSASDFVVI